jgi:hypothetical protein
MICEGQFTGPISFQGAISTDYPEDALRMDIDGATSVSE